MKEDGVDEVYGGDEWTEWTEWTGTRTDTNGRGQTVRRPGWQDGKVNGRGRK